MAGDSTAQNHVSIEEDAFHDDEDKGAGGQNDLEEADLEVVKKCLGMNDDEMVTTAISDKSKPSHGESLHLNFDFRRRVCMRIANHPIFVNTFMALTFYALFAPDFDQLAGNKASREFFLILNSLVCICFFLEIFVQSFGQEGYACSAYICLDIVALISLLPDTWVMQKVWEGGEDFVAGRSSRLARIIRVASRSSKATRLQRLTKLTRVAASVPKIGKYFGSSRTDDEVDKVLQKKLHRIFRLFDDDMDGLVLKSKVTKFLDSMKVDIKRQSRRLSGMQDPTHAGISGTISHKSVDTDFTQTASTTSMASQGMSPKSTKSKGLAMAATPSQRGSAISLSTVDASKTEQKKHSVRASKIDWQAPDEQDDETTQVNFNDFSAMLQQDPVVGPSLKRAVDAQLKKATNMKNITSRHSEYIAVRVALGVILLLFLLSLVQPSTEDKTFQMGLESLSATMRLKYPNAAPGEAIPDVVQGQIEMWQKGNGQQNTADGNDGQHLLWLDVNHLVYCDTFTHGDGNCTRKGNAPVYWQGLRPGVKDFKDAMRNADCRFEDMSRISVPDLENEDLDDAAWNEKTTAITVIVNKGQRQTQAAMSFFTTLLVICVILAGIVLLTKDLTLMSSTLLKPLRELADDMESLAQLQLAGAEDMESRDLKKGTDEIRQIRNTFEKMKKAIKSWGKYVPWPVVQMLLRANVEADLKVDEVEASMYFSDIAGFTTIVESLPPEKSLLLLNRYFNDMTKVIDDHGGVVIEFIGDAILCVYGAPLENPYHSSAAVKAAMRMLGCLRKINTWSQQRGMPEVKIRCGVHTGKVLVGNMGFQSRIKYGIVGEDAQIPSRLEEANKQYSTQCLISHYTYTKLLENHFLTRPVDVIRLRHAPGSPPEKIHQVMDRERKGDRSNPLWEACDCHEKAMELYLKRNFIEARRQFEQVAEMVKNILEAESDPPTDLLIKRCDSYIKDPPPEDWDGVFDRS